MATQGLYEAYKAERARGARPYYAMAYAKVNIERGRKCPPPRKPSPLGHGDVLRWRDKWGEKRTAVIAIVQDDNNEAPWENEDGHRPVSEWTRRDKRPGELVLCEDRSSKRYYDFEGACKIALRDGWNAEPYDVPGETRRQRAARAVWADYHRLRKWCDGQWYYVGICLFELPRDGEPRDRRHVADAAPFGILRHAALWGIESDCEGYHETVARELMSEL
jgi:hypothetical protein